MIDPDEIGLSTAKTSRRLILETLQKSHPAGASERVVIGVLNYCGIPATTNDVKRHLAYLEEKGLIKITDRDRSIWEAKITASGIDIMERETKTPPGIAEG